MVHAGAGASFFYDRALGFNCYEAQEVRAFGLLLNDVTMRLARQSTVTDCQRMQSGLSELVQACLDSPSGLRPAFAVVAEKLGQL